MAMQPETGPAKQQPRDSNKPKPPGGGEGGGGSLEDLRVPKVNKDELRKQAAQERPVNRRQEPVLSPQARYDLKSGERHMNNRHQDMKHSAGQQPAGRVQPATQDQGGYSLANKAMAAGTQRADAAPAPRQGHAPERGPSTPQPKAQSAPSPKPAAPASHKPAQSAAPQPRRTLR